jgi:hypothetical protein
LYFREFFGANSEFNRWIGETAEEASQAASRRRLDDLFQSMLHRAFNGEL